MRELDKEERSPRYIFFMTLVGVIFSLLILRLFTLQILNASTYEEKALQNRIRTNIVKATRGEIYDRDGKLLAKNITGYQLVHYDTKNLGAADIALLKEIQSFTDEQIEERLSKEKKSRAEKIKETVFGFYLLKSALPGWIEEKMKEISKNSQNSLDNHQKY